jgi:hypothetical protein
VILKPIRATVGNPRCAPVYPTTGTKIVPEYQRMLDSLGITYRQWNYWQSRGWLPNVPWYEFGNSPENRQRAFDLSEAARLKAMSIPELADYLAEERKAYDPL